MKRDYKFRPVITIISLLILTVLLGLCPARGMPEELKQVIENNRIIQPPLLEDVENKLEVLLHDTGKLPEVEKRDIASSGKRLFNIIRVETALKDVDFLFRVLLHSYAGYNLQGGHEIFTAARKSIEKEIEKKQQEFWFFSYLSVDAFRNILIENFSFIDDGHFFIHGHRYFQQKRMFLGKEMEFKRCQKGFFYEKGGQTFHLKKVGADKPDDYMKLSINQRGELVYRLGFLLPEEEEQELIITLINGGDVLEKKVTLSPARRETYEPLIFKEDEVDGIPIIVNRNLVYIEENMQELDAFNRTARMITEEKVAILDLRGHEGGMIRPAREWIAHYSRRWIPNFYIFSNLRTSTAHVAKVRTARTFGLGEPQNQRFEPYIENWNVIKNLTPRIVENEGCLIVLIDTETSSAGEQFARLLHQLENVIIIGSNTAGKKTIGGTVVYSLPHSATLVAWGTALYLDPDLTIREGTGYLPDLWVHPEDALELAVKFINNYLR